MTLPSFVHLRRAGRRAAGDEAVRTYLEAGHEKTDCWKCALAPYRWDTDCRQYLERRDAFTAVVHGLGVRAQQLWGSA